MSTSPPPSDADATGRRTVADVMTACPRSCSPFSTVTEAALLFQDDGCDFVPIVDDGKPTGILTDRDVALAVARHPTLQGVPVADIMTRGPATATPDEDIDVVHARLVEADLRRLLVVDADGRLAGIVSREGLEPQPDDAQPDSSKPDPAQGPIVAAATRIEPARGAWAWLRPAAFWELLRTTAREWSEDKVPRLGAALAFYSALSIAPVLLIAIAVAALAFDRDAVSVHLLGQIRGLIGDEGAQAVEEALKHAQKPAAGTMAALIGFATLAFAASGVFGQLQDALNTIWEVRPKPGRGLFGTLKDRFFSLAMVLGSGFLLLTSLVLSTAVAATFDLVGGGSPALKPALQVGDTLVSAVVVTLLFAMIFKLLPDAKVAWRDVWTGAALTTALFLVGKAAIGAYLGRSSYGSAYGAAGSLVVLLAWVYYSSQILFFGAEFTKVYAERYGMRIEPASGAEPVTAEGRAQEGTPKGYPRT